MPLKVTYKIGSKTVTSRKTPKNIIKEGMETSMALAFNEGLAKTIKKNRERTLLIISMFFQRLCSRTPLDENYKKGDQEHKADKDFTRYKWYIKSSDATVFASDILKVYPDAFDTFNDPGAIGNIFNYFDSHFPNASFTTFSIGNTTDQKKFNFLEYGGYKQADPRGPFQGERYQHGAKNKHSIQAPVGMLRITEAEIGKITKTPAKTNLATRYMRQIVQKIPTERELNKLRKFLKQTRITSSDMKNYYK